MTRYETQARPELFKSFAISLCLLFIAPIMRGFGLLRHVVRQSTIWLSAFLVVVFLGGACDANEVVDPVVDLRDPYTDAILQFELTLDEEYGRKAPDVELLAARAQKISNYIASVVLDQSEQTTVDARDYHAWLASLGASLIEELRITASQILSNENLQDTRLRAEVDWHQALIAEFLQKTDRQELASALRRNAFIVLDDETLLELRRRYQARLDNVSRMAARAPTGFFEPITRSLETELSRIQEATQAPTPDLLLPLAASPRTVSVATLRTWYKERQSTKAEEIKRRSLELELISEAKGLPPRRYRISELRKVETRATLSKLALIELATFESPLGGFVEGDNPLFGPRAVASLRVDWQKRKSKGLEVEFDFLVSIVQSVSTKELVQSASHWNQMTQPLLLGVNQRSVEPRLLSMINAELKNRGPPEVRDPAEGPSARGPPDKVNADEEIDVVGLHSDRAGRQEYYQELIRKRTIQPDERIDRALDKLSTEGFSDYIDTLERDGQRMQSVIDHRIRALANDALAERSNHIAKMIRSRGRLFDPTAIEKLLVRLEVFESMLSADSLLSADLRPADLLLGMERRRDPDPYADSKIIDLSYAYNELIALDAQDNDEAEHEIAHRYSARLEHREVEADLRLFQLEPVGAIDLASNLQPDQGDHYEEISIPWFSHRERRAISRIVSQTTREDFESMLSKLSLPERRIISELPRVERTLLAILDANECTEFLNLLSTVGRDDFLRVLSHYVVERERGEGEFSITLDRRQERILNTLAQRNQSIQDVKASRLAQQGRHSKRNGLKPK